MDKIVVLDFGGQYAHLIANRIRRLGVYSEILDGDTPASHLKDFKGIILSGGPQSVYDEDSIKCDPEILKLNKPILGICYGHQLMAYIQKAEVVPGKVKEYGPATFTVKKKAGMFEGLNDEEIVWMSHGDTVNNLPAGYEVLGSTPDCEYAAIGDLKRNLYGTQFHLEVTHTPSGMKMLQNFLNLCGCKNEWKIDDFINQELETIKQKVGDKKVFMLISGGVDSTVAYALLQKALGPERVFGLFVDTGFMRLDETKKVSVIFEKLGFKNLMLRDESKRFFESLEDKYDPEAKRKIAGDLFLKAQAATAEELKLNPDEWLLGQGTIYPDTIETGGTKHAAKIKTHHNRVPQIEELIKQGKVIEPLMQLYKDEVRMVGQKLGLPEEIIWRHPFPGPGLIVRCLCVQEAEYLEHHGFLEKNINSVLKQYNLCGKVLPIKSVGVQGDFRTYRHPLVLIGQSDFATVGDLATQLINQFKEINRVVWLIAPDKIEEIDVRPSALNPERIHLLQQADDIVNNFIHDHKLERDIWQFPTVLLPLCFNKKAGESIVLRPVSSEEAMTANFYAMDLKLVELLSKKLMALQGISAIFYDVTNKPPGTIEWE